jgi:hypothetical protein
VAIGDAEDPVPGVKEECRTVLELLAFVGMVLPRIAAA